MNQIKIALVLIVAMFVLLVVAGVTPTLAGSPSSAPPTVGLPTPAPTKPAATLVPAGKAPTRAAPNAVPTKAPVRPATGIKSLGTGSTDASSFTIQNIDTSSGSVTVTFYDESGVSYQPTTLNGSQPNPFSLNPGDSFEVYPPAIPSGLPNGRYSVVASSTVKVAAIANITGAGTVNFNESYSSLDTGATTFYMPAITFNYYGWYSLVSIQNVGNTATNVTMTIKCLDGTTGTLTQNNVPAFASVHFDLFSTTPTGFTSSTSCNGAATITTSGQPVVAVDNQRIPTSGNMQSYSGVASGGNPVYVPALYNSYYGWNSSLNILKIGAGTTNVTVTYGDGGTSPCSLSDATPSCQLYMPVAHPAAGYFGATIQSTSLPIVAVANAANGAQAQTYNGVATGTGASGIPTTMKAYYGWNTSVTCQNIGTTATTLHVVYAGYAANAYDTPSLSAGQTKEIYTPGESFLPNGQHGGMTVTANTSGALVSCIVNFNNAGQMATTQGSWSMSTNAFSK